MKHMVVKTGENTTDEVEVQRAVQDSEGNVIANTYAKTSGNYPNMTVGNATHADSADSAVKATQDGNGDNIAATYAKQNGTYPNLTAGEAAEAEALKGNIVAGRQTTNIGWHKAIGIKASDIGNTVGAGYSGLVLINGVRGSSAETGVPVAGSGMIEIDSRVNTDGTFYAGQLRINILDGSLGSENICGTLSEDGTEISVYINISQQFMQYNLSKLSEGAENTANVNAMKFTDEYYGTDAPEGAVFAVNRNNAAYAQEAAMLDEAYKAGNNSSTSQNGYVKLIDFTAGNNWAEKTLRLEFGDDNASNVPQNPCGMEIRVQWNSSVGVSPRAVLLYGDKQIADKLYVSYNPSFTAGEENTVSVYYKVSGGFDTVAYKPMYMTPRQGTDVTGVTFYQPTQSDLIAELPSGNTNTAITALENFRDLRYAKYDADGNDISDTYAKQSDISDTYARQSNISNPNLIMNPDFKINQRNKRNTNIGRQSYGADRWKQLNSNGVVFTSDDFLQITGDMPATNLSQPFEEIPTAGDYTLSVMSGSSKTNLSVKSMNFTITDSGELQTNSIISLGVGMYTLSVYITDGVFEVRFTCLGNSGTCYVKWVKLEPGTVATKFVPPDPATELLKCQRYYIAFSENAPFSGWTFSTTSVRITIPVPTAMREAPTLVFPDGGSIGSTRIYSNGGTLTPSAYSVQQAKNNQIVLSLTVAGATANQTAAWRSISKAALDAEI